jgi:hypothetical protein
MRWTTLVKVAICVVVAQLDIVANNVWLDGGTNSGAGF